MADRFSYNALPFPTRLAVSIMPAALASFFQKYLAQRADEVDEHIKGRRARLSAAALLVEVVNADGKFTSDERGALFASVQSQFSLADDEARDLLALAEQQTRQATDLHEFTTSINTHFKLEQKLALIQELWRVAYADKILHLHEERVVRKVGDLLHVSHSSVLFAKQQAQTASHKSS
jgi:uncharacterized tellurite resistance protein B-like protein